MEHSHESLVKIANNQQNNKYSIHVEHGASPIVPGDARTNNSWKYQCN